MEICVPCNTSACQDISSNPGSLIDSQKSIQDNSKKDISLNELKTCLTEFLSTEDNGISTTGFNPSTGENDIDNGVRAYECKDSDKGASGDSASVKCLSKCATFPPVRGPNSSGDVFLTEKEKHEEDTTAEVSEVNGSTKPFNQFYSRSISLPTPLKLVSALKGSREKLGIPPKKLSVTWSPDVYDPIPTSVSHVPSNKNQRYRSDGKKSGKYKHKGGGKYSKGSRGKDKKQGRKNGGVSNKLKPFHEDSGVVGFGEPLLGAEKFSVGSPDPFCGSSEEICHKVALTGCRGCMITT